ncbi:MAG: sodium:proton antiporter NhaD [Bacteroidales bacterium]|nr:sodium:proton antiporter NhaD [Bacteroidales bacterium]
MTTWMVIIFLIGYLFIALEHPFKINKAASALLTGALLWVLYLYGSPAFVPKVSSTAFNEFITDHPQFSTMPLAQQCIHFVAEYQIIESLGSICSILLFLLGAMTIVEVMDAHGGFNFITSHITTRNKRKLLWMVAFMTFFMSSVLDNLTTAIVMIMLIRKLLDDHRERWLFASIIVIAANSGGAWSPIGDVTTIMLWVNENITTSSIMPSLILPSLTSMLVPALIVSYKLRPGNATIQKSPAQNDKSLPPLPINERAIIFILGIGVLLFVPVFKAITHFPPFMGILLGLGILWVATEIMYNDKPCIKEQRQLRVGKILHRLDGATLLFFLGILLAVNALSFSGILESLSDFLDNKIGNVYAINLIIGIMSAVIDNVPLVAGAMGMYTIVDPDTLSTAANPEYLRFFVQDGIFWQFLAYCSGVGGSILIIGSAAGVVAMALEKINFIWYLKKISLLALAGYSSGAIIYILQNAIFSS